MTGFPKAHNTFWIAPKGSRDFCSLGSRGMELSEVIPSLSRWICIPPASGLPTLSFPAHAILGFISLSASWPISWDRIFSTHPPHLYPSPLHWHPHIHITTQADSRLCPGVHMLVGSKAYSPRGWREDSTLTRWRVSAFCVCLCRLFWAAMRFFSLLWTFLTSSDESWGAEVRRIKGVYSSLLSWSRLSWRLSWEMSTLPSLHRYLPIHALVTKRLNPKGSSSPHSATLACVSVALARRYRKRAKELEASGELYLEKDG